MRKDIGKYQKFYNKQLISAEEFIEIVTKSTIDREQSGEISYKIAIILLANLYKYVGEKEIKFILTNSI